MPNSVVKGRIAQTIAVDFLIGRGLEIVGQNFYSRFGEIDIIAKSNKELIFVEVKSLSLSSGYSIYTAVTKLKLSKLNKTINYWLINQHKMHLQWRLDLVGLIENSGRYCIEYITNL
jgi:putative endonuclease